MNNSVKEELYNALNELIEKQLKEFKWRLHFIDYNGRAKISIASLEKADAQDVVDLLIQHYGEDALEVCIDVLRKCNRNDLAKKLEETGQKVGQSTEVKISVEEESKNGIKLCPQNLFQQIQTSEGTEIYPINDPKTRTRLALIICNIKFNHLDYRQGAEVDLEQMKLLLEDLGYNVKIERNLSSEDITTCLKNFAAREEHKASDGMFVVLMSHGLRDVICGVHSEDEHSDIFSIDTVFSIFNNKNCQALRGKPKVVIIQACRGAQRGYMVENVEDSVASAAASLQSDSHITMQLQTDDIKKVNVESDFICLYSTTPDRVSLRHPETGSLFIKQLIDTIKKHAWNCNLEEVFRKVMQHFANNPCQMPSKDRTTLTKKFYLFPGH
ncbi:caspase-1-like isoform X2 [Thamnophis elegans]|uniref:caspase-1-like isoform X2 n=1 Tax=Thamnophis elegans TaxID=35005 RepID=UPI001377A6B0|nr:caspase-1-like isoform X2 [Thamnophis elegans]